MRTAILAALLPHRDLDLSRLEQECPDIRMPCVVQMLRAVYRHSHVVTWSSTEPCATLTCQWVTHKQWKHRDLSPPGRLRVSEPQCAVLVAAYSSYK